MKSSDWQPKLSTLRERCKYAFNNSLFCDVEFSVEDCDGNKVTVPANKYPLAVSSPVFAAMFYGKLAETKSPINIQDCTKEGLQEILRFAHSEEAILTGSNVMEVLYLAKKYMMPFLEEKCKEYLQNEVGPKDVLYVLPQVQKIGDKDLEEHFWGIFDKKTDQVVSSESFLDVPREFLSQVLKRDTLDVDELHFFKSVDKWVTKRIEEKELVCNGETKRTILGEDVIRLIRFPLIAEKDFVEFVLPCKVLNMDEVIELLQFFKGITTTKTSFIEKKRFVRIPRVRFNTICDGFIYQRGKYDILDFSVNKTVDLVGVRLFGSKRAKYKVDLKISKNIPFAEYLSRASSSYVTESEMIDGLYYGFTVTLDKLVRLEPGVVYNIVAEIDGPPSYYGIKAKESVKFDHNITVTYRKTKNTNSWNARNASVEGQFPTLVFGKV